MKKMKKHSMYKKHVGITVCLLLVGALLSVGFTGTSKAEPGYAGTIKYAGCRQSSYGISPLPVKEEWERDMMTMASYWPGSTGAGIWIVGTYPETGVTCYLEFPSPNGSYENIAFDDVDRHENYLAYFDTHGIKVWLQVEPAFADMCTLIDLVLDRYGSHPCVLGFGVDVEWYRYTSQQNWGQPVTDEEAENWEARVKLHNENFTLFLKHFTWDWMPPNYRGDIVFVDDSQKLRNLGAMVSEFATWASTFYPNDVLFQFGYPADEKWWSKLANPPKDIGDALDDAIPNNMGVFWVDFTLRTVFPPLEDDTTAPVIENVASSNITYDSATITWDTDEVSDSVVNYGTTTALGSTESDVIKVISHSITLTGLSASTIYYYEVKSTDCAGNATVDNNNGSYYTFTTTGPDTTPPVIENVASSNITYDSATITWDTDELSDSVVNYGTSPALGSTESDATMVTSHSITLTELSASTTYYYEVQSTDPSSNTAVDDNNGSYYTFTTAAPDTTPPVIENVASSNIKKNSATITWDTDEIADSLVKYGTSPGNYTDNKYDSAYVTSHSIGLTDLTENTTYYYVVKSTDPSNNSSESSEYSFTTLEAGATVMHVHYITMFLAKLGVNTNALAEVKIVDAEDNPVGDATVYGHWENATSDSDSGITDANGVVDKYSLQSDSIKNAPSGTTFTFVIDNVTKDEWTYDPEANVETQDSITVP
ncbi:MAG: fibronectin type III domain-containing protein [Hadesarchaea archaeon]|nr:fibronectin type III domain-containing protein [Hadesarchaea archaeon]